MNTRASWGIDAATANGNGLNRSVSHVHRDATSTTCQRGSTVPTRIIGNRYSNPNDRLTRQSIKAMAAINTTAATTTLDVDEARTVQQRTSARHLDATFYSTIKA